MLLSKIITHHSVITSSLSIKILKIDKFGDFFRTISIITVKQKYLEMLSPLRLINVNSGASSAPPAETKCAPATLR